MRIPITPCRCRSPILWRKTQLKYLNIGCWANQTAFCRRHFQMHFRQKTVVFGIKFLLSLFPKMHNESLLVQVFDWHKSFPGSTSCVHGWAQYTPALITTRLIQKYSSIHILQSLWVLHKWKTPKKTLLSEKFQHCFARWRVNGVKKKFRKPHFRPNIGPQEGWNWC